MLGGREKDAKSGLSRLAGMERRLADTTQPAHDGLWPHGFHALAGSVLGDALGAPFEGMPTDRAKSLWAPGADYPARLMPLGAVWTESQMMLSVIDSFLRPMPSANSRRGIVGTSRIRSVWTILAQHQHDVQPGSARLGGWRGAGGNFRSSIDLMLKMGLEIDVSSSSLSCGPALRCVPVAVAAHDATMGDDEQLMALAENVIAVTSLTSHKILAVVPAFSYAYLLYRWTEIKGPKREKFIRSYPRMQLLDVAMTTRQFEEIVAANPFFVRSPSDLAVKNEYSTFLEFIANTVLSDVSGPQFPLLNQLNEATLRFAARHTPRRVLSMNDGMAISAVTSAMVTALLMAQLPFLEALQVSFSYGGATNSVGALLGGLLGAAHLRIDGAFTNQLACKDSLFAIFRAFLASVVAPVGSEQTTAPQCPTFLQVERQVNDLIVAQPDGHRPPRYNSPVGLCATPPPLSVTMDGPSSQCTPPSPSPPSDQQRSSSPKSKGHFLFF